MLCVAAGSLRLPSLTAPQLDRRAACLSKTLGRVLDGGDFTENEAGTFSFPSIQTHILELVVRFMLCVA